MSWLHALKLATSAEERVLWLRLSSVESLEGGRFLCRYDPTAVRRGSWRGVDCRFDMTFEGARVIEARQKPNGAWTGSLRVVDDEGGQLVIQLATGRHPASGDTLYVLPTSYLRNAYEWLNDPGRGHVQQDPEHELLRRRELVSGRVLPSAPLSPSGSVSLRPRQREALALAGRAIGVCWGPPGTGKTTTLAALVARCWQSQERVLVLAPTLVAADGACLAIDALLSQANERRERGDVLRVQTPQLVEQFRSQNPDLLIWDEEERDHTQCLIAVRRNGVKARAQLLHERGVAAVEAMRLAASLKDAEAHLDTVWKNRQKELIASARIVVSTVRTAVNRGFAEGFSQVVVDEASMVSRSDGLILLWQQRQGQFPSGSMLFFGDPKQLPPVPPRTDNEGEDGGSEIAAAERADAIQHWFGEDILTPLVGDRPDPGLVVMLNEQSRMNREVCKVVSDLAYGGELVPTAGAPPAGVPGLLPSGICIAYGRPTVAFAEFLSTEVEVGGAFGVYQPHSARVTIALARALVGKGIGLLICSPFRAQSTLIQRGVRDLRQVKVGTIHRMQGQEADVCIFDPAQARHAFIGDNPLGRRLITVAASRARRCLVISNDPAYLRGHRLLEPFLSAATCLPTT